MTDATRPMHSFATIASPCTLGLCLALALPLSGSLASTPKADAWLAPLAGTAYRPAPGCPAQPLAVTATVPGRPPAARYRVCSDQAALFASALAEARATRRLLLVEFGATWCPSCSGLQAALLAPCSARITRRAHSRATSRRFQLASRRSPPGAWWKFRPARRSSTGSSQLRPGGACAPIR